MSPPPPEQLPPPSGAPSFLSAVAPRRRRATSSNREQLSLRVALQMVFSLHSTILLSHLPFLMRCEPRGPQWVRPRKKYEEIRDSLSDCLFRWIYQMKKSSFESQYSILQPRLDAQFLPNGGGTRGLNSSLTYIITTKIRLSIALHYFAGGSVYDICWCTAFHYNQFITAYGGLLM